MQQDKENHIFKPNSRFGDVVALYNFDRESQQRLSAANALLEEVLQENELCSLALSSEKAAELNFYTALTAMLSGNLKQARKNLGHTNEYGSKRLPISRARRLLSIIPLLLYLPCTVAFLYLYNYSPTKLILLPQNYEGSFRIVYGEPCGHPYDVYDGMKTINIDSAGIVLMREKFDGKLNFKYRFAGEETNDIRVLFNLADTVKHDVAIIPGSSSIHYATTSIDLKEANEVDFRYSEFFLYRKGWTTNFGDETVDSLTISTIQNCRNQFHPK